MSEASNTGPGTQGAPEEETGTKQQAQRRETLSDRIPVKGLHAADLVKIIAFMRRSIGPVTVELDGEAIANHAVLKELDLSKHQVFTAACPDKEISVRLEPGRFLVSMLDSNDHDYRSLGYGLHELVDELVLARMAAAKARRRKRFRIVLAVECGLLFSTGALISPTAAVLVLVMGTGVYFLADTLVSVIVLGYVWGALFSLTAGWLVGGIPAFWTVPIWFLLSFGVNAWIIEQASSEEP